MVFKLCAAAVCALALCACSPLSLTTSTDGTRELMRPPTLSTQQEQVKNALRDALGTDAYKLKYPSSGEYRSAFTFHDVDGDGSSEALAFYSLDSDDSGTTHMAVLDNGDGNTSWVCVANSPGMGTDVAEILFTSLGSRPGVDILVGWKRDASAQQIISAYRFADGQLGTTFPGTRYNQLVVDDLDGDEVDDLLLVASSNNGRRMMARLVKPRISRLEIVSEVTLNQTFSEILKVSSGRVTSSLRGVVIDGLVGDTAIMTEVVAVDRGKLLLLMGADADAELYSRSSRLQRVYARDVDGDGILELPFQESLPGYEKTRDEEKLLLTSYCRLVDATAPDTEDSVTVVPHYTSEEVTAAYVDLKNNCLVKFPANWVGEVTAAVQPRSGEIKFFAYTGDLEDQSAELLRIRCYSQQDYQDRNETEQYIKLRTRGAFEYYGYIHVDPKNSLSITPARLQEELFSLL